MGTEALPFLPTASIGKRLAKIVKELDAQLALEDKSPDDIHMLRRNIKRLRAWNKLVDGKRKIDRRLKDAASCFSSARDAHVMTETLEVLPSLAGTTMAATVGGEPKFPGGHMGTGSCVNLARADTWVRPYRGMDGEPQFPRLLQSLREIPAVAETDDSGTIVKVRKLLKKLQPTEEILKERTLLRGLRSNWRKALRHLEQARQSHSADDLHRFRRQVKYLCYQLELVLQRKRADVRLLHKRLDELGSELGDFHDIVVLEETLQKFAAGPEGGDGMQQELAAALLLCQQGRQHLMEKCFTLAEACMRRNPFNP